ncbi:MAG: S9 family peptidase [Ignavibacteriae bacterium]|nr:S9 family peptidase [Ignavibacteriota bacterium]MCB9216784.1 S9 family peptidase [Ignavibacteria bacterium]
MTPTITAQTEEDHFLWLEEVLGERALRWVEQHNEQSTSTIQADAHYQSLYNDLLEIYNDTTQIPFPNVQGSWLYNFWQDGKNERGLLRRTTEEAYLNGDPNWQVILDIDKLAEEDGKNWVYKGSTSLYPEYTRTLLELSRGGSDATVLREFDRDTKTFVEDGFNVPEAKTSVSWVDQDNLYIGTDFGEGSMTTSGYPRIVKKWKRGTPIEEAETIFEGESTDIGVSAYVGHTPERDYHIVTRNITFFTSEVFVLENGEFVKLDIPADASIVILHGELIVYLRSAWEVNGETFAGGSLISIGYDDFLSGKRDFQVVIVPDEDSSINDFSLTKDYLLVNLLRNVRSELYRLHFESGVWKRKRMDLPTLGSISLLSTNKQSNRFFLTYTDFLTPTTLYQVDEAGEINKMQSNRAWFDAERFTIEQRKARSKDGTEIPYFLIGPKEMKSNGDNPTILTAYGGFQVSRTPHYSPTIGRSWLEEGGVYVIANIRGGGEYGPGWHQAAMKENKQRSYEDFFAVAEDLIADGITSPERLGIMGGSNGGLLMGAAFTQHPELFNAVVCAVPLLDMKRYHKLLAGASWMAEYGDPDNPEEWEYISRYSPYQNLSAEKKYPQIFFTTSTRDDRVHPGHARKMAARMEEMGNNILYYENMEGGHAGAANNRQTAMMQALEFIYFRLMLMGDHE